MSIGEWSIIYPPCDGAELDEHLPATTAEQMAVELLWRWTGQQFGVKTVVVRPCSSKQLTPSTWRGRGPYTNYPNGFSGILLLFGCPCAGSCACKLPELKLPGPALSVTEVLQDGVVLDPTLYQLQGNSLERRDGEAWPLTQDLALDSSETGTLQVTYRRGREVPTGGKTAAGVLAQEIEKSLCESDECQLPRNVQSITRQGVSMDFGTQFDEVSKGHTGIWLIDSWIASVTGKRPTSAKVMSPDLVAANRPRLV